MVVRVSLFRGYAHGGLRDDGHPVCHELSGDSEGEEWQWCTSPKQKRGREHGEERRVVEETE